MSDNFIHDIERDERRSALADMSEMELVQSCGHFYRRGVCVYCSDVGADWSDV